MVTIPLEGVDVGLSIYTTAYFALRQNWQATVDLSAERPVRVQEGNALFSIGQGSMGQGQLRGEEKRFAE